MFQKIILQKIIQTDNVPKNFFIVDNLISRSAQPTIKNFIWLKKHGYTDIINFRTTINNEVNFNEENIVRKIGMKYHWLPTIPEKPTLDSVKKFFNIINKIQKKNRKVLIHCKAGADRTGMYVFLYKTKNNMDNTQKNINEWIEKGHDYIYFPHMISWAKGCAKRLSQNKT